MSKTSLIKFTKLIPQLLKEEFGKIGIQHSVKNKVLRIIVHQDGYHQVNVVKKINFNKDVEYIL